MIEESVALIEGSVQNKSNFIICQIRKYASGNLI